MTDLAIEALLDADHPLKVETSEWASAELATGDRLAADRDSVFAADDWKLCADRGIQGLLVAEEFGGRGRDLISALLTLEGLGHGCRDNGLVYALASQIVSTQVAVERFGSEEQKRTWLPSLCNGSRYGVFAITEPESGSDTFSMRSHARRLESGDYELTGHKAFITMGPRCDVIVFFARTDPDAGQWGVSAFLVDSTTDGVTVLPHQEKMGMRTTPFGDLVLDGVRLPATARLGPEGAGASIFTSTIEFERAIVYASQIGAMERMLDDAVSFARTREQSGRPIGAFQAVSHRIADMAVRHETARLALYKTGMLLVRGRSSSLSAAMTKLVASEGAVASALDATVIHGARGFVSSYGIEHELRDAVGGLLYSGTSDIQKNIVARLLGVG